MLEDKSGTAHRVDVDLIIGSADLIHGKSSLTEDWERWERLKTGILLPAEGVELDGGRGLGGERQMGLGHGLFERVGGGGKARVEVVVVEAIAFRLGERDELKAARAIEIEKLREQFGVESADVHEENVGDVAVVESFRKAAIKRNGLIGGGEIAAFELGDGGGISFGHAARIRLVP